ncbi:5-(carboxyamino)imidazole ribonucleotide synthase [soil metagenome]
MNQIERVGIICDGQLGRMIVEDGLRMRPELEFYSLGENGLDSPSAQVGAHQVDGSIKDPDAIRRLAQMVDVITWEIEHIDTSAAIELASTGYNVQPSPISLEVIQDKLQQKQFLASRGIPVARFTKLEDASSLLTAQRTFGSDLIIKSRRGGYDGRGNSNGNASTSWESLVGSFGGFVTKDLLYAEEKVGFQRELSLVGARDMAGKIAVYPVVEVRNKDGKICSIVKAPAAIDLRVSQEAEELGRTTIDAFEGAGVWAIEMFQDQNDNVLVNEVAPRVHNTGHWTDLGAATSQFEQHVRAITGMPLGETHMRYGAAVMINILSTADRQFTPAMRQTQATAKGHVRWYGKAPKIDGSDRKIGHITAIGENEDLAMQYASELYEQATGLNLAASS